MTIFTPTPCPQKRQDLMTFFLQILMLHVSIFYASQPAFKLITHTLCVLGPEPRVTFQHVLCSCDLDINPTIVVYTNFDPYLRTMHTQTNHECSTSRL